MNEAETRAEHIDPALRAAGWGVVEGSRVRREYPITMGRLEGAERRGKPLTADYVLDYRNTKLAVVEAKAWDEPVSLGLAQAKNHAGKLAVRFAYSTNGRSIYAVDLQTGAEREDITTYPTPDELWAATFAKPNAWRDRFADVPFEDKGGSHPGRYYQDIAVARVLEAIGVGRSRILLTLATGTGKTFIAFQLAAAHPVSRRSQHPRGSGLQRVLRLRGGRARAHRARRHPQEEQGAEERQRLLHHLPDLYVWSPKDGEPSPYFGEYPPDFFDFVVIDECHRGGAKDERNWRGILEYFTPAVQLGLTATPKRRDNVDTYAYFGEPVFIYSLKDGINDGFLTPFRVRQISTTLDDYVYTQDDTVISGQVEEGRRYGERDFNRIIEIKAREQKRAEIFMRMIDQREKTLVFCATQDHALAVRDLINQLKTSKDPNYCQRVMADDGALGEQHLRDFQDYEKTIPTILTTSQKLSTGVDARNIRHIVLLRPINSMIEFKQIIGRGTRLYDGKDYFTIYDFVKAHLHFSDPEWDGEPLDPEPVQPRGSGGDPRPVPPPGSGPIPPTPPREKLRIRLADGKARTIQHMAVTTFWHPDGTPMSAQQFMEALFGKLPEFFRDEDELRALWSAPDTQAKLLDGLAEKGFGREQLAEMQRIIDAEKSDLFDVLAHVAYALPPLTRQARADKAKVEIHTHFNTRQQVFLAFVLSHYVSAGVDELAPEKLTALSRLRYHDSIADAVADLGRPDEIGRSFVDFQRFLYQTEEIAGSPSVA
jgi:type I restriction enzyme R subunit